MRWRRFVLLPVLAAMLAAAGVVTWEARRTADAARATADQVARDYAAFAAWQYARAAGSSLETSLTSAIAGHDAASPAGVFRADVASGELEGEVTATVREAFQSVRPRLGKEAHSHDCNVVLLPDGAAGWHYDAHKGGRTIAHGAVVDRAFVSRALAAAAKGPLLPPGLIDRADTGDVLALRVTDRQGARLFESGADRWSDATASAPIERPEGFTITASISASAAPRLVIGGLPRSRLGVIYGLLALSGLLILVAAHQMRRESQLVRLRSDFVSGVSHELRTPLTQIRMFAETLVLKRTRNEQESTRAAEVILQESNRLTQLVDNVLRFARSERVGYALDLDDVSLSTLAASVADGFRQMADARGMTLATDIEEGIVARADAGALRQVLVNLVDNAVKYGPAGQTITIGLRRTPEGVRAWVQDEGQGIAPHDAERIWEPFWRVSKNGQGGSGIGLAIVRDLVRLHGGRAFLESSSSGARFVFTIPAAV